MGRIARSCLSSLKALLDLPQSVIVREHIGGGGIVQIGDDAGQAVPSRRFGDLGTVDGQLRVADDGDEAF